MNPYVESLKPVWENPQYVFVNDQAIDDLACKLATDDLKAPTWREDVFPESEENILEFFGVANAINFCFTDFKTGNKFDVEYPTGSGQIKKGSFAMTASLKRALDESVSILDPKFLIDLDRRQVEKIFRCHATAIPMLDERIENLRNVGWALSNSAIKSFRQLFELCDYRLFANRHGILEIIPGILQSYLDTAIWKDRYLQFQKRAQLLAAVYQGRALSSNGQLPLLKDVEKIGPIADYQLPRALRFVNVLRFHPILAKMVDSGKIIDERSIMWIEIRAQTVQAMCKLLQKINGLLAKLARLPISMVELDYPIFIMGRNLPQLHPHPYVYTKAC